MPDPISPDNPYAKYAAKSISPDNPYAKYAIAPAAPTDTPSQPNLLQKYGALGPRIVGGIGDISKDVGQEFSAGKSEALGGAQQIGEGGIGNIAKGAGKYVLGSAQQVFSPVSGAAKAVVGDPIRETFPGRTGQLVGDTAELGANMVGPGGVTKLGREAVEAGPELINAGKKLFADILADKPVATSDAMRKLSGAAYKEAEARGGLLTPQFSDSLIDEASKVLPQTAKGKTVAGDSAVTQLLDRLEKTRGTPTSLQEMQEMDEHIGDLIDKEWNQGRLSKQGAKLVDIQSKFRDMIENAEPQHVGGGPEGFQALSKARQTWSQAMKMSDIERLKTRAEHSEQPVTVIRTGIKNILSNPAKTRGYSPEELSALKKAYKTGILTGPLRMFGSRFLGHVVGGTAGAAGGGFPGWMAGEAAGGAMSAGARKAGTALQMKKLDNVLNVLGQKSPANAALSPPSQNLLNP